MHNIDTELTADALSKTQQQGKRWHICTKTQHLFWGNTKGRLHPAERDCTLCGGDVRRRGWCDYPKIKASPRERKKRS